VVSDVPVDDKVPVVTSRISRSTSAQSFEGAHRGKVCVRVFIGGECACVLCASTLYCVNLKNIGVGFAYVYLRTMCGSRTGGWSLPCVMSD
jgi:hypothetical protein